MDSDEFGLDDIELGFEDDMQPDPKIQSKI